MPSNVILQELSRFGSSVITVKSERKVRKISCLLLCNIFLPHLAILDKSSHMYLTHLQKSEVLYVANQVLI